MFNINSPKDIAKNITKKTVADPENVHGPFRVVEYVRDPSVNSYNAERKYFSAAMNVRKRQVMCNINNTGIITQAGAMQYMVGNLESRTDIKGVGDMVGKMFKSSVAGETPVKPVYCGQGTLVLEPTYKYIILEDVADWQADGGIVVEDGMFLACESSVTIDVVRRSNISSAVLGGEGLFNTYMTGQQGIVCLESNVPREELMVVNLKDDCLKVDGPYAVCWSKSLQFTVERSSRSLIGSAVNGEGFVNVFRGTGRVYLAPISSSTRYMSATTNN